MKKYTSLFPKWDPLKLTRYSPNLFIIHESKIEFFMENFKRFVNDDEIVEKLVMKEPKLVTCIWNQIFEIQINNLMNYLGKPVFLKAIVAWPSFFSYSYNLNIVPKIRMLSYFASPVIARNMLIKSSAPLFLNPGR